MRPPADRRRLRHRCSSTWRVRRQRSRRAIAAIQRGAVLPVALSVSATSVHRRHRRESRHGRRAGVAGDRRADCVDGHRRGELRPRASPCRGDAAPHLAWQGEQGRQLCERRRARSRFALEEIGAPRHRHRAARIIWQDRRGPIDSPWYVRATSVCGGSYTDQKRSDLSSSGNVPHQKELRRQVARSPPERALL